MSTESAIDSTPISTDGAGPRLESLLGNRPAKAELVDKNILKNSTVAPSLQAAQQELERKQVEDKLTNALASRPPVEKLVEAHIVAEGEL